MVTILYQKSEWCIYNVRIYNVRIYHTSIFVQYDTGNIQISAVIEQKCRSHVVVTRCSRESLWI
jgi:hypothetical protein